MLWQIQDWGIKKKKQTPISCQCNRFLWKCSNLLSIYGIQLNTHACTLRKCYCLITARHQNPEKCWDLLLHSVAYHQYSNKDTIFLDSKLDNCACYILKLDTYFVSFSTLLMIYSSFPSIQHSHCWVYSINGY